MRIRLPLPRAFGSALHRYRVWYWLGYSDRWGQQFQQERPLCPMSALYTSTLCRIAYRRGWRRAGRAARWVIRRPA